jgi:hypothetical protein
MFGAEIARHRTVPRVERGEYVLRPGHQADQQETEIQIIRLTRLGRLPCSACPATSFEPIIQRTIGPLPELALKAALATQSG